MNTKKKKELPKGIYQRLDGRYQASYYFDKKRYYLYDTNLDNLMRKLHDAKSKIEHGVYCKPEKIRLDEWFEIWIREYKGFTLKKGTIENYRTNYLRYIQPYIGHMYIKDIRVEHIQQLYNMLLQKGYAISTLNVSKGVLSGMFQQLVKNDILNKNPVNFMEFPHTQQRKNHRVLSQQEQHLFLECAKESDYFLLYLLGFSTGLRIGELCALQWSDLNFDDLFLTVNGTLKYFKDTGFLIDTPKTLKSQRSVPLLPIVCQSLKNWKYQQTAIKIHAGLKWCPINGLSNLVFTNPNIPGEPVRKRTIAYDMDSIVANMNNLSKISSGISYPIKHISPHAMRHTFATRALENGIPPKVVQEILGHSSIAMTLDLYTHVLPKTKQEEILKLTHIFL